MKENGEFHNNDNDVIYSPTAEMLLPLFEKHRCLSIDNLYRMGFAQVFDALDELRKREIIFDYNGFWLMND